MARTYDNFFCFSYPKCGTHLLADIVRDITGLKPDFPGVTQISNEMIRKLPEDAFLINHSCPENEVVPYFTDANCKVILNLRDPRDQLISFYFYYTKILDGGNTDWGAFLRQFSMEKAIDKIISSRSVCGGVACPVQIITWTYQWHAFVQECNIPFLFVTYEDLVERKAEAIARIASFLEYEIDEAGTAAILEKTSFNKPSATIAQKGGKSDASLKRKGKTGDWKNHFSEKNKEKYKALAGQFLIELGYEKDLDW